MPAKIEIHNTLKPARKIYAYVDFEDLEIVEKHRWYIRKHQGILYPMAHICNRSFDTKMTSGAMAIGRFLVNPEKGKFVSYLDGNPFNCIRENIIVTDSPNTKKEESKSKLE